KERVACICYLHGGAMQVGSIFDPTFNGISRILAAEGVAVVMIDFRNAMIPSSAPEVAPFPAGLNDCVSGVRWVAANADALNIDPKRIVVAGDSGGGKLTPPTRPKLARDGGSRLIKGVHARCPHIAGNSPRHDRPSPAALPG